MMFNTQQHQTFSSRPSQESLALIFVAIRTLQIIHLHHGCCFPAPSYWNYSLQHWTLLTLTLAGLLLLSLWSLQKMSGKKSLGAVSQFPLITWRRQLITSRVRARGHCRQALSIEKTFPWDCLGRSLPQLKCQRTACAGKGELKVGKQLVSTTTMYMKHRGQ